ncbi:MAG: diguanylate cyclase [Desulfuromonas sp.]|nr:diguanylate cyclase [Desulfuromonas sp.]
MKHKALLACRCDAHRRQISTIMQRTGIFDEIISCNTPHDLQHAIEDNQWTILFRDMYRPVDPSFDWRWALDSNPLSEHIPLIALTCGDQLHEKVHAFDTGANDCIGIDAEIDEISARIRLQLRNYQRIKDLYQAKKQLAHQALTDELTGLYNRSYFDATLKSELSRCQRSGKSFSLLMLDLDHFKRINDSYGHACGDQVLQLVSHTLKDFLRASDVLCRYGGEEFTIILPETPTPFAYILARRLHKRITKAGQGLSQLQHELTVSIGISSAKKTLPTTPRELLDQADKALYFAKQNGRNRSEIYTPPPTTVFDNNSVIAG